MTVHLYAMCWDEVDLLEPFFRHYDPWVDRYVIFDDGSTDGSLERLDAHPRVEVRPFVRADPDSFVASQVRLQDEVWKESRGAADWVVVTAVDEHLHVPGRPMRDALEGWAAEGATLVPALGYQMLSDEPPRAGETLAATRTVGAPHHPMSKLSLWRPDAIARTAFAPGRHRAWPEGEIRFPARDELLNLHYKYLGFDRLVRRHARLDTGLGETDRRMLWGHEYAWPRARLVAEWDAFAARAFDLADRARDPVAEHPVFPWWRRPPLEASLSGQPA